MPASGVDESDFQRARIGGLRLAWSEAEPAAEKRAPSSRCGSWFWFDAIETHLAGLAGSAAS